jgi:hypothetical protein
MLLYCMCVQHHQCRCFPLLPHSSQQTACGQELSTVAAPSHAPLQRTCHLLAQAPPSPAGAAAHQHLLSRLPRPLQHQHLHASSSAAGAVACAAAWQPGAALLTLEPACAAKYAAVSPAAPPPTTITGAVSSCWPLCCIRAAATARGAHPPRFGTAALPGLWRPPRAAMLHVKLPGVRGPAVQAASMWLFDGCNT